MKIIPFSHSIKVPTSNFPPQHPYSQLTYHSPIQSEYQHVKNNDPAREIPPEYVAISDLAITNHGFLPPDDFPISSPETKNQSYPNQWLPTPLLLQVSSGLQLMDVCDDHRSVLRNLALDRRSVVQVVGSDDVLGRRARYRMFHSAWNDPYFELVYGGFGALLISVEMWRLEEVYVL
jgi:hypothetical protein